MDRKLCAAVGIQEWSAGAYDNFRPVELAELETFAAKCAATSESLMKTAIPLFHGGTTIVVNDGDGLTKGWTKGTPDTEGQHGDFGAARCGACVLQPTRPYVCERADA